MINSIKDFYSWVHEHEEDVSEDITASLLISFFLVLILEYFFHEFMFEKSMELFDMCFLEILPIVIGEILFIMGFLVIVIFHILVYIKYK